jgi:hypothetical protein
MTARWFFSNQCKILLYCRVEEHNPLALQRVLAIHDLLGSEKLPSASNIWTLKSHASYSSQRSRFILKTANFHINIHSIYKIN